MQREERTGPKGRAEHTRQDSSISKDGNPSVNMDNDTATTSSDGAIYQTAQEPGIHPHEDAMKNHDEKHGGEPRAQGENRQNASSFLDSDDEMGITITDDELWEDADGLDEVPLFDEEELIGDDPNKDEHTTGEGGPVRASETGDDTTSSVAGKEQGRTGHEGPDNAPGKTENRDEQPSVADEKDETGQLDESLTGSVSAISPWMTWTISGIGLALIMAGLMVLWELAGPYVRGEATNVAVADTSGVTYSSATNQRNGVAQAKEDGSSGPQDDKTALQSKWSPKGIEAIDLAPFLIPAQREGELVFFKLKVELIVPDATTKHALKKREAWVRDIIYTQLKGIDISPGEKGNVLLKYRRPLLARLNKKLSPLEIRDVRIMGFLLK